jgi:YjbR protein
VPRKSAPTDDILRELRAFGLAYPGAHTKSPWPGHLDLAVKDKTFAYLSLEGEPLGIGCKLPHSCAAALMLPNTQPTPYGLGKSGWVSAKFEDGEVPDVDMLKAWIDESYRAQAPKKLVAQLDREGPAVKPAPVAKKKTAAKKTPVAKKKTVAKKKR